MTIEFKNILKGSAKTKYILVGIILALFILMHQILLYKNFVIDNYGNIHSTIAGFADIPYHLTQVSKFAFGPLNSNDPIYDGTKLRYSFAVNLLSGLLLRLTNDWVFSVNAPVMFFAFFSTILVFIIYNRLLKSWWASLFSLILFYIGSGFGAYDLIKQQIFDNHLSSL